MPIKIAAATKKMKMKRRYGAISSFVDGLRAGYGAYKTGSALWRTYKSLRASKSARAVTKRRKYSTTGGSSFAGGGTIRRGYYYRTRNYKKTISRKKLMALGVANNSQPHIYHVSAGYRIDGSQGLKTFLFLNGQQAQPFAHSRVMLNTIAGHYSLVDGDSKVCYANSKQSLMISNSSNGGIYITVLWVRSKRDWTLTMGSNLDADPMISGFVNVGLANSNHQMINVSLKENKKFMYWFDIVKTQGNFLQAGETMKCGYEDHNVHVRKLQHFAEPDLFVLKGTVQPFFIFHGTPIHGNATTTQISTAVCAIDVVWHHSFKSWPVQTEPFSVTDTSGLASIVDPRFFSDQDVVEATPVTQ